GAVPAARDAAPAAGARLMRTRRLLAALLPLAVLLLLGWISQRLTFTADWTYGNRASLTEASKQILRTLDQGPIEFTVFAPPGSERDRLRAELVRYLRASDAVQLTFVDPARQLLQTRQLNLSDADRLQISYQGRAEVLQRLSEPAIARALLRLSTVEDQWIVFLQGHAERSLAAQDARGYSVLAAALDEQGLKTRALRLAEAASIPANAAVLVLAGAQMQLLPGEVELLQAHIAGGGNLLWLHDPGSDGAMPAVAATLGIEWLDGTLIYPDYQKLGTAHPAMALVARYPQAAITANLDRLTLFPLAGAVAAGQASAWQATAFLQSTGSSWLETSPLERGVLRFEPEQGDQAGPLAIGLSLTRRTPPGTGTNASEQRVVVIANSGFLSNEYINTHGNRQLAMAVFRWLAQRDAQ